MLKVPAALRDSAGTIENLRKLARTNVLNLGMGMPTDEDERAALQAMSPTWKEQPSVEGEVECPCAGCGVNLVVGPNVLRMAQVVLCPICVVMCGRMGAKLDLRVAPSAEEREEVGVEAKQ